MKVILQAIKALFRKIEASRTHWEEVEEVEILTETTITIPEDNSDAALPKTTQLTVGQTYFVILDGVSYECVAWYSNDGSDAVIIGNGAIFGGEGGNSEPFSCDSYSNGDIYLNTEKAGTYAISISTKENVIHKLDKKYLPDEVIKSINNAQTTANNAQSTANSKMNSNNPVGTGSFSMGRKAGSVIGPDSHAEGSNTIASSNSAHAEGYNTTASGNYSHAEGGNTTASTYYSHAEGSKTIASNNSAHAEGSNTIASGLCSHAEGLSTTASGYVSHAEGYHITASGSNSHVQGKFNIEDLSDTYAHIVGNGSNNNARSNAHTLDWNGNAWYAGDVYIGSTSGTNKDEGSKKLATEEYVDSKQVQPDWNQNDSTAADYVKNRTHYEGSIYKDYVLNMAGTGITGLLPEVGETMTVIINGVESSDTVKEATGSLGGGISYKYIGNIDMDSLMAGGTGWCIAEIRGHANGFANPDTAISIETTVVHKINEKFINFDGLVRTFDYYFKNYDIYKTLYKDDGSDCILYMCDNFILPEPDSSLFGFMGETGFSSVGSTGMNSCFVQGFTINSATGRFIIQNAILGTNATEMKLIAENYGYTHTTKPNA